MSVIHSCKLINFKNYSDETFHFHPHINAFVGQNGMGKTNALDALHMLSYTKSHFIYQDKLLIKEGNDFFRLEANFSTDQESHRSVFKYPVKKKKVIELDGAVIERITDYIGILPLIFFSPDASKLIFGGSAERRKLIDRTISQFDRGYLKNLMVYNKLLHHRNQFLLHGGQPIDRGFLASLDHQIGPLGDYITKERVEFVSNLTRLTLENYSRISNEKERISIIMKRGYETETLLETLKSLHDTDITAKRTTKGIHRDDLELLIQSMPFNKYGSQGQIKSLLLSIRMAQLEIIKSKTQREPVFIIDDVFDKLDEQRISHLINMLKENPQRQVFVSYTNQQILEQIFKPAGLSYRLFEIKEGKISHEKTE